MPPPARARRRSLTSAMSTSSKGFPDSEPRPPHPAVVKAKTMTLPPTPLPARLKLLISLLKGGDGKTTTTWFLGCGFGFRGYRALLVDADLGSRSLTDWYERAGGAENVPFWVRTWNGDFADGPLSRWINAHIAQLQPDAIIVDIGGERRDVFMSACLWADRLLCPVGPSPAEIVRIRETLAIAGEVAEKAPIAVSALLNRVPAAGKGLAVEARQIIERTDPHPTNDGVPYALHCMDTEIIANRHLYSVPYGTMTVDIGEYELLVDELLKEMGV